MAWTFSAVIGLGPNLFYGTGLAACILVFRQRKAGDRRNKVLIIDASKGIQTDRAQNELLPSMPTAFTGGIRTLQMWKGLPGGDA